jgi:hypothetical protein
MRRFQERAPMYLDAVQQRLLTTDRFGNPEIEVAFGMQTVMRHYGAPTRLLDWSESPWVSLYFACEDAASPIGAVPRVGRILAFDRMALQREIESRYWDQSASHAEHVQTGGRLVPRLFTRHFAESAGEWAVCYHHYDPAFPRLVAQQGLFTFASRPWLDHWQTIKALCPTRCIEIHIAPELKAETLRRLMGMGLTAATLFPGVEGVSREILSFAKLHLRTTAVD